MKIYIVSLGCAKNTVDSECLAGVLRRSGHELVESIEDAEAAIVNTCGFIRPAVEENVSVILDLERLKIEGALKKIGVVGCLVNRYGSDLKAELPSVDIWAESEDWCSVAKQLGSVAAAAARERVPVSVTSKFTRYLKVSEGCDNRCSYCTIPNIRGGLRSLSVGEIVDEACKLAEDGARELCLVGQDIAVYGSDRNDGSDLLKLIDALEAALPQGIWLRLLYLHPSHLTRETIERAASGGKVLPYLDIPIQHSDPALLSAMNRAVEPAKLRGIFDYARSLDPKFALRTTCMVGFPGETRKSFLNLLNFLGEVKFDRVGAFEFQPEEGTVAAECGHQVTGRTKARRLEELMSLQEEISFARQELFVGERLDVLVEHVDRELGFAEGRSFREAPEVDGVVEIRNIRPALREGDIITVEMKEALVHDMVGEEVEI